MDFIVLGFNSENLQRNALYIKSAPVAIHQLIRKIYRVFYMDRKNFWLLAALQNALYTDVAVDKIIYSVFNMDCENFILELIEI